MAWARANTSGARPWPVPSTSSTGDSFSQARTTPGGVKSMLFGGEGVFLATLTGPGKVWLQSLPFSRMADRILSSARAHGGSSKGEGSALDLLGGLGNLLDGK